MKPYSFYRAAGRQDMRGHWSEAAMLTFVYFILTGGCCAVFSLTGAFTAGSGTILTLLLLPMSWGLVNSFLVNHRGGSRDPFDISCLVEGYRDFWRIFSTYLLCQVYTYLWTLLLIIPGIIKSCSYAMTPYILKDRPDLARNEAIELSMAMMQGHKLDYFVLCLTFIGWAILSILTLGIGYFWLLPYFYSTLANFYEEVKQEFENGGYLTE